MPQLAKRPRRSEDYETATTGATATAGFYDNVPGTSITRPSSGSGVNTIAAATAAYLAPYTTAAGSAGANGTTSPLLASHLSTRSLGQTGSTGHHHSSGAEDNVEDMAPPGAKTSSSHSTRARGRGRGRPYGRGRGRPRGSLSRAAVDSASYSDDPSTGQPYPQVNGHTELFAEEEDGDNDQDDGSPPNPLTFQCRKCFRLLADSFSFVATDPDLGYVILSQTTECVLQDTTYSTSTDPNQKDLGSTFARLRCAGCNSTIGRNYRTTPRDLDDLRDCFSLEVNAISTYQLGSNYTKQLDKKDDSRNGRTSRGGDARQSIQLGEASVVGGLESKMERTRALTIELSDRLIKAELDIRRYSAQVQQLLKERDSSLIRLPLADVEEGRLADQADASRSAAEVVVVEESVAEEVVQEEVAEAQKQQQQQEAQQQQPNRRRTTAEEEPTTPPPADSPNSVKQESHPRKSAAQSIASSKSRRSAAPAGGETT
ncbi:uncharacterized protein UTRI_03741 [Ustilago trichophora]|uniref:Mis18 domain-containing protein n=1 Tax=Ustilago trichophora TaxID=86804 RepID=A0A5C3E187_9BASI|nr:uncharacterized protein UTRI_03741 [Ustilago trichophora]